jgi:hypothetical protein
MRKFNLCLKFLNKRFRQEQSDEDMLILIRIASNSHFPALPFLLGDQAAVPLLKLGLSECPIALATPLFTFKTRALHIPIFMNFLNKKKPPLIPACMFAISPLNFHDAKMNEFLRNSFTTKIL